MADEKYLFVNKSASSAVNDLIDVKIFPAVYDHIQHNMRQYPQYKPLSRALDAIKIFQGPIYGDDAIIRIEQHGIQLYLKLAIVFTWEVRLIEAICRNQFLSEYAFSHIPVDRAILAISYPPRTENDHFTDYVVIKYAISVGWTFKRYGDACFRILTFVMLQNLLKYAFQMRIFVLSESLSTPDPEDLRNLSVDFRADTSEAHDVEFTRESCPE